MDTVNSTLGAHFFFIYDYGPVRSGPVRSYCSTVSLEQTVVAQLSVFFFLFKQRRQPFLLLVGWWFSLFSSCKLNVGWRWRWRWLSRCCNKLRGRHLSFSLFFFCILFLFRCFSLVTPSAASSSSSLKEKKKGKKNPAHDVAVLFVYCLLLV